jgi:hypothetical protein
LSITARVIKDGDASRIAQPDRLETRIPDDAFGHVEIKRATVAAEGVVPFADGRRPVQLPPVAWPGGVVEQHFLVQIVYTPHIPSHSPWKPSKTGKPSRCPKSRCSMGCKERCRKTGCPMPVLVMSRIILSKSTALANSSG